MAAAVAGAQPAAPLEDEPWQENLSTHVICPDCKEDPPNLVEEYSSGDMVCGDCGLIVGARIVDMSSEWRTFSNDDQNNDDPSRVGDAPNILLNGDQLTTEVAMGDSAIAKVLRRAQGKAVNDKGNKNLVAAYRQIDSYCGTMALPAAVSNYVKVMYKESTDNPRNPLRLKSLDVVLAGLIFIACRELNIARTFREIHKVTKVSKKEIGKTFKILSDWRQTMTKNGFSAEDPLDKPSGKDAANAVIRYNSQLGLSAPVARRVEELAKKVDADGVLDGRSPLSVAGAIIWFVVALMDEKKTIQEVSKVVGVSDSTIRSAFKVLCDKKERLVGPDWLNDGRSKFSNLESS